MTGLDGAWGRAAEFFTFRYAFTVDALMLSLLVGLTCGVVGVFLVLRRQALLGDAVGHAALPGVCAGYLVAGSASLLALWTGALVSALLAASLVSWLARSPRARPDAMVALVLAVFFGIGAMLLSALQGDAQAAQQGLTSFLLGNAAAATRGQVVAVGVVGAALLGGVFASYRPLVVSTFDPAFAASVGITQRRIDALLAGGLSIAVVLSVQAVGAVLVAAMLITPASAALLLARRVPAALALSAVFGISAGVAGAVASYSVSGVSTGPAMVLAATVWFVLAAVYRTARQRRVAWST